jgi:phosphohistidine phosphatase
MELILWRHAEAEEGAPDDLRALTGKGHKQAAKVAGWLDRNLPNSCKVLVSPTKRTMQTAEALQRKFKITPDLAPASTAEVILKLTNWPENKDPVLIVGHQPTLGHIASIILTGIQQDWTIRKGNVWWISSRERGGMPSTYIKAIASPDLM